MSGVTPIYRPSDIIDNIHDIDNNIDIIETQNIEKISNLKIIHGMDTIIFEKALRIVNYHQRLVAQLV